VFLLAGALTLAIAIATISFKAIKAARANPVDSLRYE
jgi:putative ABC transport system permease protein